MSARKYLSWRSLTPQVIVFIILPLSALLLLVLFGGLRLHEQSLRSLVGLRDERTARAAAANVVELLERHSLAIHNLALHSATGDLSGEMDHLPTEDAALFPQFDGGIAVVGKDGGLISWFGDRQLWAAFDQLTVIAVAQQTAHQSPTEVLTFEHPMSGQEMLLVAAPVEPIDGTVVGVFSSASLIETAVSTMFTEETANLAFVVDQQGQVLYSNGDLSTEMLLDHPGVVEVLRGESGHAFDPTGVRQHVVAYSPIENVNWGLVIEEPWELATSPLFRLTEFSSFILLALLLLAVVALWFISSRIVAPLLRLETKASELAWGDFGAIEERVGGVQEIQRLQETLIHLAQKVNTAQQALRGYIGAITTGQEEERKRLARELHDDTLQALIALNQRVQMLRLQAPDSELHEQLDEIQSLTEETIQDLRRLTRALRPIYLEDLGLVAAIDMLVQEAEEAGGIATRFECTGEVQRLSAEEELAMYRITQEALANVVNHSYASDVQVLLAFRPNEVALQIRDNGRGFTVPQSPAEFAPLGHYGLLGLFERAELIGADLKIESRPTFGTVIQIRLPNGNGTGAGHSAPGGN